MLEVIDSGQLTTVQDRGRIGWARYGVPPSGPMDALALTAANELVDNTPDSAGLEITLHGPILRAWQDCLIAVCGAEFELWVGRLPVPTWSAIFVRAEYLIRFGARSRGARAYLAIAGGIDTPPFLGSRSTHLKGGFGGLDGRALFNGDYLAIGPLSPGALDVRLRSSAQMITKAGRAWPAAQRPIYTDAPILRVVLGPQHDHFTPEAMNYFLATAYTLTPKADRMGIHLQGERLTHRQRPDGTLADGIVSDGLVTGSIQVPPNGQPIVMMVDHQTTGGYPKIATVIRADLPLLAQCLPGNTVRFRAVSVAEASAAFQRQTGCSE
ncbi:MAG: biotin-dependent carboxyltransferase family protein [Anaerolineae bacterium]|jgi:antagonist of KipI|nr:biotin-dependent carboxyltransferase family protein [Anaerolineae bacterium]